MAGPRGVAVGFRFCWSTRRLLGWELDKLLRLVSVSVLNRISLYRLNVVSACSILFFLQLFFVTICVL